MNSIGGEWLDWSLFGARTALEPLFSSLNVDGLTPPTTRLDQDQTLLLNRSRDSALSIFGRGIADLSLPELPGFKLESGSLTSPELERSRDSGFGSSNLSSSADVLSTNTSPPFDPWPSPPSQTLEPGFVGCESYDSFNQMPSINNFSYDGCFFEDDVGAPIFGRGRARRSGVLAAAVSGGGDLGVRPCPNRRPNELSKTFLTVKYTMKLRKCWHLLNRISRMAGRFGLNLSHGHGHGHDLGLGLDLSQSTADAAAAAAAALQPQRWNVTALLEMCQKELSLLDERVAASPRLKALTIPAGQLLRLLQATRATAGAGLDVVDELHGHIQAVHWALAVHWTARDLKAAASGDLFRFDKAYTIWNQLG